MPLVAAAAQMWTDSGRERRCPQHQTHQTESLVVQTSVSGLLPTWWSHLYFAWADGGLTTGPSNIYYGSKIHQPLLNKALIMQQCTWRVVKMYLQMAWQWWFMLPLLSPLVIIISFVFSNKNVLCCFSNGSQIWRQHSDSFKNNSGCLTN